MIVGSGAHRWRRGLSVAVAVFLTISAVLAVALLLAGEPGPVQGRILGTTALLAGFGILALPAAMLLDLGRARGLSTAVLAVDAAAAALGIAGIWSGDDFPEALGKLMGIGVVTALALAQVAALTARRRPSDPAVVGPLFIASSALAAIVTAMISWFIWTDSGDGLRLRVMASLLVLDLLAVSLQPVLARVRPGVEVRMRVRMADGAPVEVDAQGRDLAAAVASGIRRAEGGGETAVAVDILERHVTV